MPLAAGLVVSLLLAGGSFAIVSEASPTPTPPPDYSGATLMLSVSSGPSGTPVTVAGRGFPPSADLAIYFDSPNPYVATPARLNGGTGPRTGNDGTFKLTVTVVNVSGGPHNLCAATTYPGSTEKFAASACAQFAVVAQIRLSPASGAAGSEVAIFGSGFPAFTTIAVYADAHTAYFGTPGPASDAQGSFSLTGRVPYLSPGAHLICGQALGPPDGPEICAPYEIVGPAAYIGLVDPSGQVGSIQHLSGRNFDPNARLSFTIDGFNHDAGNVLTDYGGVFSVPFVIRVSYQEVAGQIKTPVGRHELCAATRSVKACTTFTVLSPPPPATAPDLITGTPRLVVGAVGLAFLVVLTVLVTVRVMRSGRLRR
jgi:hypothetical protein